MEAKLQCKRPGCNKPYTDSENTGVSCRFHSGKPIFHDLKKGWSCCQAVAYEWSEFEKLTGCCTGPHSSEKHDTEFWQSSTVQNAGNAIEKERIAAMKTAADFNREQEEAKRRKEEEEKKRREAEGAGAERIPVLSKDGKNMCANKGCAKRSFLPEENSETACSYHSGDAIFHDLKKYWSCCTGKVAYDWDDFMKLPSCQVGPHQIKYKQ